MTTTLDPPAEAWTETTDPAQIRRWMLRHATDHLQYGTLNLTSLVETWDVVESSGEATLDPDHPAWDVAVEVAELLEGGAL